MGFPARRLPEVAFRHVYDFLNYTDLIVLSQCSKATYNLITSIETHCEAARIRVMVIGDQMNMTLADREQTSAPDARRRVFNLDFAKNPIPASFQFKEYKVGGRIWKMGPYPLGFRIPSKYDVEALLFWVQFLKDLFNCQLGRTDYWNSDDLEFDKFFRSSDALHQADQFNFFLSNLNDSDLEFAMDNFTTDNFIYNMLTITDNTFVYDKPIRFPRLHCTNWYIQDFDNFMRYVDNCESLYLTDKRITDKDINTAIRGWINSDNTTLAGIVFTRDNDSLDFNIDTVLEGLTALPGTKKRKEATKHTLNAMFENGKDLIRADGVRATVLKDRVSRMISFTVWSDKDCIVID